MRMNSRIVGAAVAITAWAVGGFASPIFSRIEPVMPSENDSIQVVLSGVIGGGDRVVDSGVRVDGATLRAHVSVKLCTGACPMSMREVAVRIPAGKLLAGNYSLLTTLLEIVDTAAIPDTMKSSSVSQFTVYPASPSPLALVGVYQTIHGAAASDSGSYYYRNGDTLSIVALLSGHCSARFGAGLWARNDTAVITVIDTSDALGMCDTDVLFYVTVAVRGAGGDYTVIVKRRDLWGRSEYAVDTVHAVTAAPAACINVQDVTYPGLRLYPGTSWRKCEIISPVVRDVRLLRLQPNPAYSATSECHLYFDNITVDTAADPSGPWTPVNSMLDTLDGFETYYSNEWQVVAIRDSSRLTPYWVLYHGSHLLELSYYNPSTGFVSNYVWKPLSSAAHIRGYARISLWVTAAQLQGATSSRSVLTYGPGRAAGPEANRAGYRPVRLVDIRGRAAGILPANGLAWHACPSSNLSLPAGAYFAVGMAAGPTRQVVVVR